MRSAAASAHSIARSVHALFQGNARLLAVSLLCLCAAPSALAAPQPPEQACPRPAVASAVQDPPELRSRNGVLEVTFHFTYQVTIAGQGPPRYCYVTDGGLESPTLRVHAGDQLIIHFHNDLPAAVLSQGHLPGTVPPPGEHDDCHAGAMNAAMTNLHFHGLTVPPTCHQDDVISTAIQPGDYFDYRLTIPRNEPPGLYWYHPHPHGFNERQVQGGASGALIVEGLEAARPALAGLPQRVIVLRDQSLTRVREVTAVTPAWDISINYVPVLYPVYELARIETAPSQKELWRVLNAAADTIFNLQIVATGVPQPVRIVAIDGVPTSDSSASVTSIELPPGARMEFVVETPKPGEQQQLVTTKWDTGPQGDSDPARPIAEIVSRDTAAGDASVHEPESSVVNGTTWQPPKLGQPILQRRLYFSQLSPDPREADSSVFYFITVLGQAPAMYRMGQKPNITVHQGDVEDWTVENRSQEDHVFHIHQIHFQLLEVNGKPVNDNALRDTIDLPYWNGEGPYPSVKLRMDFRDPNAVGTFLYHCHILKHEDMGMMGVIQVLPPGLPAVLTLSAPAHSGTATLITVTATVTSKMPNAIAAGGSVQFTVDGITTSQPIPLAQGKATFTTSFDAAGTHVITATYAGDANYDVAASRPLNLKVVD
jgi:FtsP/CotA-like multicopper oxidase with cupredoxin domain